MTSREFQAKCTTIFSAPEKFSAFIIAEADSFSRLINAGIVKGE